VNSSRHFDGVGLRAPPRLRNVFARQLLAMDAGEELPGSNVTGFDERVEDRDGWLRVADAKLGADVVKPLAAEGAAPFVR
jgi:hypothetical protein